MHLAHLRLRDFRNYQRLDVDFSPGFHLLLGDNAQGKTNILEAVYLMATLRSFRGVGGAQLIRHGQKGYFVGGKVVGPGDHEIKMFWSARERNLTLDNRPVKKLGDYLGTLRTVVFCTEDLQLVKGTGRTRRRFLDLLLSQERIEVGGKVTYRGVAYDLTAQRDLERRLKLASNRFQHFFDKAPIGVALLDLDGRVSEHNPAFSEILGNGGDAIGGRFMADLVKPERDLLLAYDDPLQVTAAFNRNLLVRVNRELEADFAVERFAHRAVWNQAQSRIEMHLVSLERQRVKSSDKDSETSGREKKIVEHERPLSRDRRKEAALLEHRGTPCKQPKPAADKDDENE